MSGVHNKHAEALATMVQKVDVSNKALIREVIKRTLRAIVADLLLNDLFDEQDWRNSIIQNINYPSTTRLQWN